MKVVTSRLAGSASGVAVASPGGGAQQAASDAASPSSANGIVLMAWGAHAQKMIAGLDTVSDFEEPEQSVLQPGTPGAYAKHAADS